MFHIFENMEIVLNALINVKLIVDEYKLQLPLNENY